MLVCIETQYRKRKKCLCLCRVTHSILTNLLFSLVYLPLYFVLSNSWCLFLSLDTHKPLLFLCLSTSDTSLNPTPPKHLLTHRRENAEILDADEHVHKQKIQA